MVEHPLNLYHVSWISIKEEKERGGERIWPEETRKRRKREGGRGERRRATSDYQRYLYGCWSVAKKLEATLSIARVTHREQAVSLSSFSSTSKRAKCTREPTGIIYTYGVSAYLVLAFDESSLPPSLSLHYPSTSQHHLSPPTPRNLFQLLSTPTP